MKVETISEKILKISPSVRIVSILNMNGKLIYSAHPRSVRNRLSRKESKSSLVAAAKAWKSRKALRKKLGNCKYVIAEYDKVKRITMPAGKNHLLYVTTSPTMNHNKIIQRVRKFR